MILVSCHATSLLWFLAEGTNSHRNERVKIPSTTIFKRYSHRNVSKNGIVANWSGWNVRCMLSREREWKQKKKIERFQTDRLEYVHQDTCIFFSFLVFSFKCHQNVSSQHSNPSWVRLFLPLSISFTFLEMILLQPYKSFDHILDLS